MNDKAEFVYAQIENDFDFDLISTRDLLNYIGELLDLLSSSQLDYFVKTNCFETDRSAV